MYTCEKVFYPPGIENAILNMKSSSKTMTKTNDYFGYIRNKWWRKRQHQHSLNSSVERAWKWVSTRGGGRDESGNVLYPGPDKRCMDVDICKIH